ncbi:hypothetical protein MUN89_12965 [Halobacillus salinarum]|uniref:Permuted papain-like amidase enzyme, YaeF/YiiX, C92 family n=1 Tax=Halobacillus salinarum TaxID=2932257 RepID=A0ABY4EHC5_9BACI|nr:hypothetical protein [Halobacillus salinarum]UOQ42872.1 hypothetical protein MUN89_12965 [Halobacillus salinarum]
MKKNTVYTLCAGLAAVLLSLCLRPKKTVSPGAEPHPELYPSTRIRIEPGDLLFSPIGKRESKYVGHVGMVGSDKRVVHSIPSGLIKDEVPDYFKKFRSITIFSPNNSEKAIEACTQLEILFGQHTNAVYRLFTSLNDNYHEQYCSKLVWLSYYNGAGINLGSFSGKVRAVHPALLKDRRFLVKKL